MRIKPSPWLVLTLAIAGVASAQNTQHEAYQRDLLARSLSPADQTFCDGKTGGDACHVTRLFISDIKANKDQGFPPITDVKYASKAETSLIMDRMTKYGG